MNYRLFFLAFIIFTTTNIQAQPCRISETSQSLITYPYSDPNPVPEFGEIYPYFRFDGYTGTGNEKAWKMVEMENKYIKLWVVPEIGGKIWGAVDKKTGREFLYYNHSVKFRSIAMRGPWTSGGLEFNFGIIGHAPTCSSPVDYFIRTNPDSSVSCYIGALDLPSRTEWNAEIRVTKDKAEFLTRAMWFNGSPYEQSYYHWMNAAEKVKGNLEYIYPGSYYLGHDGSHSAYPLDNNGRNISYYDNNNFGPAKSYHVAGNYTDFFGGYWHDDDFGFGHYAQYDEKPGKKIWIWGLSRSGMIWENLLTDHDGQYTEIQSGRLFNQSASESSNTPFKHRSFLPYTSDAWYEYWFPINGTGGITYSSNDLAFNIKQDINGRQLLLYSIAPVNNRLRVYESDSMIIDQELKMDPTEVRKIQLPPGRESDNWKVMVGNEVIYSSAIQDKALNRPVDLPDAFDFNSVYGLFLQGKEWERQRSFEKAEKYYQESLKKDPYYVPALSSLAGIDLRELRPQEALKLVKTALSVDTYDPASNYIYGLINSTLGNIADALDGFSIASQSADYREAAFTQLAIFYVKDGELDKAKDYTTKCLLSNKHNLQALQMSAMIARLKGDKEQAAAEIKGILQSDPLNHFARFEKYLLSLELQDAAEFKKYIRNELPHETYLELAINYYNMNRTVEALKVLDLAPEQAMVGIWKAFLTFKSGKSDEALKLLNDASKISPEMVFPFRQEDVAVLQWAMAQNRDWKFSYYLALVFSNFTHKVEALAILNLCGEVPEFYPFYSARAGLQNDPVQKEKDLVRAYKLTADWRPGLALAKYYGDHDHWNRADTLTETIFKKNTSNYYIGLFLARSYLKTGRYDEGISLLSHLQVLPNEGASEGRNTWRALALSSAYNKMEKHLYKAAIEKLTLAKQWPENLGVGRPYDVDERLEDYLQAICYEKSGNKDKARELNLKISSPALVKGYQPVASTDLLSALALRKSGKEKEADHLMNLWIINSPGDSVALWCHALYEGNTGDTEKIAMNFAGKNKLPGNETKVSDLDFQFILKFSPFIKSED